MSAAWRRRARRSAGRVVCAIFGHEPLLSEPGERRLADLETGLGRVEYGTPCRYCGRLLWNISAVERRVAEMLDDAVRSAFGRAGRGRPSRGDAP